MFDVYIKNYYTRAGEYITDETLMYSIPMESNEDDCLIDPKVQVEMGKAGSFEFAMYIGHPYYESIRQMKTIFRIVYDGDTIFRGRVLTIETGHMTGNKKVHCEGDLAFLIDSQMEGIPETSRQKTDALTYIRSLLTNHNTQMANDMADKQFVLGQVPGTYTSSISEPQQVKPDNNYRYGSSSWKDSQSAFNELSDSFGGFWRTRYQNGTVYLDWLDNYYYPEINPQTIEIGQNLIDISSSSEVNNIFTALIPVGSAKSKNLYINGYKTDIHGEGNYILVPQILQVFTDDELNSGFHSKQDYANAIHDYGLIFRTESFSNADTQEKLWQYATDWIKNNYCGGLSSFSIGAVDMHLVGGSSGKFLIGSRVNVIYPDVDKRDTDPEAMIQKVMTVMKATYDLHHPEKNQYTIGIPNAILKKNYGEKKKGGGGGGKKVSAENEQENKNESFESRFEYGNSLIWSFVCDSEHNKQVFEDYAKTHGDEATAAIQRAAYIMVSRAVQSPDPEERKYAESIILDGENNALIMKGRKFHSEEIDEFNQTLSSILINGNQNAIEFKQDAETVPSTPMWDLDKRPTVMQLKASGTSGAFKFLNVAGQSVGEEGKGIVSTLVDGVKGALAGNKLDLANGIENVEKVVDGDMLAAIGLNGETKKVTTSADGETTNVEIDGSAEGKMTVGKDQNDDWLVIVNDKVTYNDASGNTHTLEPGFVTAKDLQLAGNNPISSFSTNFAIIRNALFDNVEITGQLQAAVANIETVTSKFTVATSGVYTDRLEANSLGSRGDASISGDLTVTGTLKVGSHITLGTSAVGATTGRFTNLYIGSSTGDGRSIGEAVRGFGKAFSSEGKINIPYYTFGGDDGNINFNIADTQFYKDSVSAIKTAVSSALANASWKQNTSTVINAMLDTTNKQLRVINAVANIAYPDNEGGAKTQVSIGLGNLDLTTELTQYWDEAQAAAKGKIDSITGVAAWKPAKFAHGGYDVEITATGTNVEEKKETVEVDASYAWSAGWGDGYETGVGEFTEVGVPVLGSAATYVRVEGPATSITIQGGETSITKQGAETSVTLQGDPVLVTSIGDAYTGVYKQGGTVNVNETTGSALHVAFYTSDQLYRKTSSGSYATAGNGSRRWWYENANAVARYQAKSSVYRNGGSFVTFYNAGNPATYYTAKNPVTYYLEGTETKTYRSKGILVDGLYEEGSPVTFYSGGSAVTYYKSGGSVTYYTKKSNSTES